MMITKINDFIYKCRKQTQAYIDCFPLSVWFLFTIFNPKDEFCWTFPNDAVAAATTTTTTVVLNISVLLV